MSHQDIHIVHLFEVPELAPTLERWFIEEWTPWYGPDGPGDAESDLSACRSRDELPICLVALNVDVEVLGTAALKSESVGSELGETKIRMPALHWPHRRSASLNCKFSTFCFPKFTCCLL